MTTDMSLLDLSLDLTMTDLIDHGRTLDVDLKNEEGLGRKHALYTALKQTPDDTVLLELALAETLSGSTSLDTASKIRKLQLSREICEQLEKDLSSGCVLSQENLADVARRVTGRMAFKIGMIGVTAVTIGAYRRQLIDLLSDTITQCSLMAANFKEDNLALSRKVRGTPKQVESQIKRIGGIVNEADKLQKTIMDIGADKLDPGTARQQVTGAIRGLVSAGVPINAVGGASLPNKEQLNPYTPEDADKSGWTSAAITTLSGALTSLENQIKQGHILDPNKHTTDYVIKGELKMVLLHAQRACVRAAHYVLFLIRKIIQVLNNVRFTFHLK